MDLTATTVEELFALARAAEGEEAYWAAVSELHRRGERRTFDLAAVLCDSFTTGERCLGADVLGQLGAAPGEIPAESPFAAAAAGVLMRLVEQDDEPAVLSAAAVGLGHLHDPRAIDPLAARASHPEATVRRAVVHGLMGHDDDRAVEALVALSSDLDSDVRDWATFSLGVQIDRDTPALRDALATRLGDSNPEARAEAILGLARRGDERALEPALADAPAPGARAPSIEEAILLLAERLGDERLAGHVERLRAEPDAREAHGELIERALRRCSGAGA